MQKQRIFFGDSDPFCRDEPTHEEKLWLISQSNPDSPFHNFIGNDAALKKIQVAAYTALGNPYHTMREMFFSIFGPSSAGKTTLARIYAEVVDLPFLEISPKSISSVDDLFEQIYLKCEEEDLELKEVEKVNNYRLPPMIIFIDEVHALVNSVVNGLLKATEFNDSILVTERGIIIDCRNVTWIIATTDEGKLFDAFRTRFEPIKLEYLTKKEISKIIRMNNPDFSEEACDLIAHYNSRIPRKALSFARYVVMSAKMNQKPLIDIIHEVARDEGIDQFGMNKIHLKILRELKKHPVAKNRMSIVAGVKDEEVEKFIMPWLLTETQDQPAFVTVSSKGYTITEAGLRELEKRK